MNYKFKTKPYEHQMTALEKVMETKKILLTSWKWVQVKQKY